MSSRGWNFADVWEAIAARLPDAVAQQCGATVHTWRDFDRRAANVAGTLVERGLGRQAKVAQFLYNGPEYLESVFAAFKASMVPVNTNYRYVDRELLYLWDNADVEAVVFHSDLAHRCEALRHLGHPLLGRDVQPRREGGAAPPRSEGHDRRRARHIGIGDDGTLDEHSGKHGPTRSLPGRGSHQGRR
jgi:acyl-CoA synthetase (AMP-forming)/AMP-acid ligase II